MFPAFLKTLCGPVWAPRGLGVIHKLLAVWFLVWSLVGLFVLGFGLDLPLAGWSDFLFNLLGALLVLLAVVRAWGGFRASLAFALVFVIATAVEHAGARAGFLFGDYDYTDAFGPRIAGVVPFAVPLAWWTVVVGGVQLVALASTRLSPAIRWPCLVAYAGAYAVMTDLPLETVAHHIRGYWHWMEGGPWYGVPLSNFIGWLVVGSGLAVLLLALGGERIDRAWERLGPWPQIVLISMHLSFASANLGAGFHLPAGLAILNALLTAWIGFRGSLRHLPASNPGAPTSP